MTPPTTSNGRSASAPTPNPTRAPSPAAVTERLQRPHGSRRQGLAALYHATIASLATLATITVLVGPTAHAADLAPAPAAPPTAPLQPIPSLQVDRYLGTWYQVAWFPNRFQSSCVSDTQANYRSLPEGRIEVVNRCRRIDGSTDEAIGQARPTGRIENGQLTPATLRVSFLPALLRWTGIGWGSYWVIRLPDDYRYAVVSEPRRQYLWVLSRTPTITAADRSDIRDWLTGQGFDLSHWQDHPQRDVR